MKLYRNMSYNINQNKDTVSCVGDSLWISIRI